MPGQYKLQLFKTTHGLLTMIANRCSRVTQKYTKGCGPQALPTKASVGPSSDTAEPTTSITCIVNVQAPKAKLFALGGIGTACRKLPNPRMARPYILGRPRGLHNPNVKLIMEKH